jgi:hypothetical protein
LDAEIRSLNEKLEAIKAEEAQEQKRLDFLIDGRSLEDVETFRAIYKARRIELLK